MPLEETITLNIRCDNPACPGTRLDPASRRGWTFVTSEVYGEPTGPGGVFCSAACVAGYIDTLAQAEQQRAEAAT